jgi:hypothetical protein
MKNNTGNDDLQEYDFQVPYMSPELVEKIYQSVLQAVLWGTDRDEVYLMLEANKITGPLAEAFFQRAWKERIDVFRNKGIRQAVKGGLLLAAGMGLFSIFWWGFGVITNRLLVISGLLGLWGLVWFMNGSLTALLASKKAGSVITDD